MSLRLDKIAYVALSVEMFHSMGDKKTDDIGEVTLVETIKHKEVCWNAWRWRHRRHRGVEGRRTFPSIPETRCRLVCNSGKGGCCR